MNNNQITIDFIKRVKSFAKDQCIPLAELYKELNISSCSVSRWTKGEVSMTTRTMSDLNNRLVTKYNKGVLNGD